MKPSTAAFVKGLFSVFISSAISAATAYYTDPQHLGASPKTLIPIAGIGGLVGLANYLKQSPVKPVEPAPTPNETRQGV